MTEGIPWSQAVAEYQASRKEAQTPAEAEFPVTFSATTTPYGRAALERRCQEVATAQEGTRNDTLNAAYYSISRLIAGGEVAEADARSNLRAAGLANGMPPAEVEKVLRQDETSAFHAGTHKPKTAPPRNLTVVPHLAQVTGEKVDEATGELRERTSWWPRDLERVLSGDDTPDVEPTFLVRDDGQRLLYPGKVNGLIGESESGKSWVAMLAVKQAIQEEQPVLFMDFEDAAAGVVGRLLKLGLTSEQLRAHFRYMNPEDSFGAAEREDLGEHLGEFHPALIVVDGLNAVMNLFNLNLMDNGEVTTFFMTFLRTLARTGAAVVYVDHVVKSRDQRVPGGIGAQAKRAMTDGATLRVEVLQAFGVGMEGRLNLLVDKDRTGAVRGASGEGQAAGQAVISSSLDGPVTMKIIAPGLRVPDSANPWRPTAIMERASILLEEIGSLGCTGHQVEKTLAGKNEWKRLALQHLVEDGFVSRRAGGRGGGFLYFSMHPYREGELRPNPLGEVGARFAPTDGHVTSATVPLPFESGDEHE